MQVNSNEDANPVQEQRAAPTLQIIPLTEELEENIEESPPWMYAFRTKYCDKEFEFLEKRGKACNGKNH